MSDEANGNGNRKILKGISWKRSREMSRLQRKILRIQQDMNARPTNDEFERLEDQLAQIDEQVQAEIALSINHIPDDWLVEDAPKDLDWSKAASLDHLRRERMLQLIRLFAGVEQEEDSKN